MIIHNITNFQEHFGGITRDILVKSLYVYEEHEKCIKKLTAVSDSVIIIIYNSSECKKCYTLINNDEYNELHSDTEPKRYVQQYFTIAIP